MKYKNLTPFKCCVIENFPFIEADFDTITNYQLFCKVVEYLNKTIDSTNILGQKVQEFAEYFENLDVQEEIDNKLDKMVESGYFENLLYNYFNLIKIYKTTNEMLENANNLQKGQIIKTLGYYNINDDGNGYFYITDTINEEFQIDLNNGLYATLIVENDILNVKTMGAKGDNITNDTEILQTAINISIINKYNVFVPSGIYLIDGLLINKPIKISGTRDTIIKNIGNNNTITINQPGHPNSQIRTTFSNIILENNNNIGIQLTKGNVELLDRCIIRFSSTAINNTEGNIYIDNIRIETAEIGINLQTSDNHINNMTSYNCMIHHRNYGGFNIYKNVHGWNYDTSVRDWTSESVFMEVGTNQVQIVNCYADTLQTIFDFKLDNQYVIMDIQNLIFFLNVSSYPNTKPAPVFFKGLTKGRVVVNSLICDFNGYIGDGTGNIVDYPNNIKIKNFVGNGVKFNNNYYYPTNYDLTNGVDYNIELLDFLSIYLDTAKMINTSRIITFGFSLKRGLPTNTEIWTATLLNKFLDMQNAIITAFAVKGANIYPLEAFIDENNILHLWNKGEQINSADYVKLNIDYKTIY